jgi:hypothetical protein
MLHDEGNSQQQRCIQVVISQHLAKVARVAVQLLRQPRLAAAFLLQLPANVFSYVYFLPHLSLIFGQRKSVDYLSVFEVFNYLSIKINESTPKRERLTILVL